MELKMKAYPSADGEKMKEPHRIILDFIIKSMKEKGYPPTTREIGHGISIRKKRYRQEWHMEKQRVMGWGISA